MQCRTTRPIRVSESLCGSSWWLCNFPLLASLSARVLVAVVVLGPRWLPLGVPRALRVPLDLHRANVQLLDLDASG